MRILFFDQSKILISFSSFKVGLFSVAWQTISEYSTNQNRLKKLTLYTSNGLITLNKYAKSRPAFLRFLLMPPLKLVSCFNKLRENFLIRLKFCAAFLIFFCKQFSLKTTSNTQCRLWWVNRRNFPASFSQNGTWTSQFIPLPSSKRTLHTRAPMCK